MSSGDDCLPRIDALKLVRDGTDQDDRFPAALDPASVPVHGRGPAESMLFARALAEHLTYYPLTNVADGDWRDFFATDVSVALAAAAVQDVNRYRDVIHACIAALEDLQNAAATDTVRRNLGWIFAAVGTLASQLDELKETLPAGIPLKATLVNLVRTRLAVPLTRLIGWAKSDAVLAEADRLLDAALVEPEPHDDYDVTILGVSPASWSALIAAGLSDDWLGGTATWADLVANTPADASVFGTGTVFERANRCAGHALFTGACDQFLKVYARTVRDASADLQMTLESWALHEPHYALFLSFLKTFEYARSELNALGGKHLDFYYRDVLRLARRPAEPAQAHVVLELAKNVATQELPADTPFKAGKDATKVPVTFTSDAALVANKAAVASLMSLYRDAEQDGLCFNAAAPSADGSWSPFRSATAIGSFGFAVASHYLLLAEGTRTITLSVSVAGYAGTVDAELKEDFLCRLTTEKSWLELVPTSCMFTDANTLEFVIVLDGDQPGITGYVSKTHASAYDVSLPVLELRLQPVAGMLDRYQSLESLTVGSISLNVDVQGYRGLTLSTDLGPVDASKPFQPFGPAPVVGSAFLIGCQEAFSKNGCVSGTLQLAWRSGTYVSADVRIQLLKAGRWDVIAETDATWMTDAPESAALPDWTGGFNPEDDPDAEYPAPFSLQATTGYVKVTLDETLGHEDYVAKVVAYAAKLVAKDTSATLDTLYTPELESITLDYSATQSIACGETTEAAFEARTARFYHLVPTGLAEQHGWLRASSEDTAVRLLPLLRHVNALDPALPAGTAVLHEGELYLGLSGVVAPQNVALLFQVEDGTADPLTEKPDPHLHFSYLRNGDWVALQAEQVADGTSELLASGVITLAIPADATTTDTLLPGGLTWIRIAAANRTQAVCSLLAVKAQALLVTFADDGNDPDFLATPLAAGSIAKLVTPLAAIKSVSQPFESFGGRMIEEPRAFYTRVSERLRHKDRAVALWDIERLVLEAFPGLHRVKCLNHTRYEPNDTGTGLYRELAAGHVTVVTLPVVSASYPGDPLTPYASLAVLEQVQELLEARLSCFATLHVKNPSYEALRVACKVRLRAGSDESSSLARLRTALTQFLAPWAFGSGQPPTFGGKVYRSALINLLEEQDCVDYVTDFRLYLRLADGTESESQSAVEGTRAVSVLTSVAAELHDLAAIDDAEEAVVHESCECSA